MTGAGTDSTEPGTVTGTIEFREHATWYQITNPPGPVTDAPVIVLHGGPGMAHNYTKTMADLVDTGRPVIHYDQLGCGNSTLLPDAPADFWTVELFVAELHNLVDALGLVDTGGFHLLGQSWGGMLAPEYVLAHAEGVLSMTLADSPASMDLWVQSTNRLRTRLPEDVQHTLTVHEDAGSTDHPDYLAAVNVFYEHFLCRLHPWPEGIRESFAQLAVDPTVYRTMIGPSEFHITGTLRDWSVVDRLEAITVPTLVLAGEHDEAQPVAWRPFTERLPNVRHHVFPGASHTPHLEARADFNRIVAAFLRENETRS
jgi:L-proline amide hydrolase